MLICIEGGDAVGKHTQAELLAQKLCSPLKPPLAFPRYDTPTGKAILDHLQGRTQLTAVSTPGGFGNEGKGYTRAPDDALVFQRLMLADKAAAAPVIHFSTAQGSHLVLDRWKPSAVAYGSADGLSEEWLWRVQACLPDPAINIFIDVTEEEALRRRPTLRDRYEKDRAKQRTVRENYKRIWAAPGAPGRWVTVDGHGTPEEVHERIATTLSAVMQTRPSRPSPVSKCG
jgi:thymidylate kinase